MAFGLFLTSMEACILVAATIYAIRVNSLMAAGPIEAERLAGAPITVEEIRAVKHRLEVHPINYEKLLPPCKRRRYIVVGGSGIVGGQIVLDLLAMGTPPSSIRIIDASHPIRVDDFSRAPAVDVAVVRADVTSLSETTAAFTMPWPAETSSQPLTVFHTVALIRPYERHETLYHRCSRVNVEGTVNVLQAADEAGAALFIYTSSCAAEHLPVTFLPLWPSSLGPNYAQVLSAADFSLPLRPAHLFANNYARSKAEAERCVRAAGEQGKKMRTGIIRPGNAVYGHPEDKVVGRMLALGSLPSFGANWSQNWISLRNASLAHLQCEDALLGPHAEKLAGKAFPITDDGATLRLSDVHRILNTASTTGLRVMYPPPLLMLLAAYAVETWSLAAAKFPPLRRLIGEPQDPVILFQPAVFSATVSAAVDDSEARKSPANGGIGYRSACSSLEGMVAQAMAHGKVTK